MKIRFWLLVIALWGIAESASAQDVIFRKNGEVLKVTVLTATGKSRSYQLPGDKEGVVRHISINAIDSILYENGTRDVFSQTAQGLSLPVPDEIKSFKRNYVAGDAGALLFYQNLQVSYEYLPGRGYFGIFGTISKNLKPVNDSHYAGDELYYEDKYYMSMLKYLKTSFRAGVNAYIFPPGFFRLSAGLSWITANYGYERLEYIDYEPWTRTSLKENRTMNGILFSSALNFQPDDFYQLRVATDIPLYASPNFYVGMIRLEVALNF
jgi:hypothetical protein